MAPETLETPGPPEFSFEIMKVAVAQICQSTGISGSQSSALETLTRITTIYLQTLAKSASTSAAAAGRTQSNIFDVVHALQDISSNQGFAGASDHSVSLLESTPLTTINLQTLTKSASSWRKKSIIFDYDYECLHALKLLSPNQGFAGAPNPNVCSLASAPLIDIVKFVCSHREIPFAKPLPRCSNPSPNRPLPQNPRNPKQSSHIPPWLPGFPDPSTYTEPKIQAPSELNWNPGTEEGGKYNGKEKQKKSKAGNMELSKEREKVRFRIGESKDRRIGIGVVMKNGVCRGGKSVSWQNHHETSKFAKQR